MNSQLIRKFAFCAVIALACTLIASVAFVSAQTYSVSVATDSSSYPEMAEVTISGLVTPAQSGYLVTIRVTDPLGNTAYSGVATPGANGAYSTTFIAPGTTQPAGTYIVSVYANLAGTQVATKTMTYTVAAASTPTPTPIPATPTPTPTPVPATPTPTPVPATPTPAPTTSPTTSPTTQPTTSPTTQPTTTPTATPAATSTPQATPTPTAPEFPFTVLAIVVIMAASAAVLLGFKKSHKNLVNAI